MNANPFNSEEETYFELRKEKSVMNKLSGRKMHRFIYNRQQGNCPVCNQKITLETGWNVHHIHPIHLGGRWLARNLVMLHPVCHVQVHQNPVITPAFDQQVERLVCLSGVRWKSHAPFWGEKGGVIPLTYPPLSVGRHPEKCPYSRTQSTYNELIINQSIN